MKVIEKILNKLGLIFDRYFNSGDITSDEIADQYARLGLSRVDGLALLNEKMVDVFGFSYDENHGMFSEHLILLAAIAVKRAGARLRVLEIGTFDGRTSILLSKLFLRSRITTIDLGSDGGFGEIYGRTDGGQSFKERRDSMLAEVPSIKFEEINSVEMINWNDEFDLIWVDGAHGYPVVAIDIANACRMVGAGGIILIDDIFISPRKSDEFYASEGGFKTLCVLRDARVIDGFQLIPKRLGARFNSKRSRKYVGVISFDAR